MSDSGDRFENPPELHSEALLPDGFPPTPTIENIRRSSRRRTIQAVIWLSAAAATASALAILHKVHEDNPPTVKIEFTQDCNVDGGKICQLNEEMSAVATEIVGHPVDAYCGEVDDIKVAGESPMSEKYNTDGLYIGPPDTHSRRTIFLGPNQCYQILGSTGLTFHDDNVPRDDEGASVALLFLGHEFGHAMGIEGEGDANCQGVRLFPRLAAAFHMDVAVVQTDPLALFQSRDEPAEYHAKGC